VRELGLADRAEVLEGRAEELAHRPELRGSFDVVIARSFGPPAVTAECAAGFLAAGGELLVTDPPTLPVDRWNGEALASLGLEVVVSERWGDFGVTRLRSSRPAEDRWPRRSARKRPLW
jgi:16S rRNA (guanine527-N7)-methyltransferase